MVPISASETELQREAAPADLQSDPGQPTIKDKVEATYHADILLEQRREAHGRRVLPFVVNHHGYAGSR